jgi:hypothetical protein
MESRAGFAELSLLAPVIALGELHEAHDGKRENPVWLESAGGVADWRESILAGDREPDQPLWRCSWLPVLLMGNACDRIAETRLHRALRRIIHLRSTRLGARTPTGRHAMARPVPKVGSSVSVRCELDMR